MANRQLKIVGFLTLLASTAVIGSCAAPVPQSVRVPQPAPAAGAIVSGAIILGTVAAIRPVSFSGGPAGAIAGVNAVLGALDQETDNLPLAGEEIVVEKDDGNTVSVAEPVQIPNLALGNRVALRQAEPVLVIRRN